MYSLRMQARPDHQIPLSVKRRRRCQGQSSAVDGVHSFVIAGTCDDDDDTAVRVRVRRLWEEFCGA